MDRWIDFFADSPLLAAGALLASAALVYLAICVEIARRFTRVHRHRAPPPPTPELRRASVHLPARDGRARIAAWYLEAAPRQAAVVFVHGKAASRGDELKAPTLGLAQALRAAGISVLMIDLRGHGASSPARLTYGGRERHDVQGAVDWLVQRGYAAERIGILGGSMGAGCALLAAADATPVAALALDSPYAGFDAMIERQFRRLSRGLPHWLLPGALAIARLWTGVDLRGVRPLAAARALRGTPMLVVHSAGDRLVPADDAHAIAQAGGGELWITESCGHLGSYRHAGLDYERRIVAFFRAHLAAGGAAGAVGAPRLALPTRGHAAAPTRGAPILPRRGAAR